MAYHKVGGPNLTTEDSARPVAYERLTWRDHIRFSYKPIQRVLSALLIVSLLLVFASYRQISRLIDPSEILTPVLNEPIQRTTDRAPFSFEYRKQHIVVQPQASYELSGLVVSHNDIHSITDAYHHADSVDTKDLCVIWGDNARNDHYRRASFTSSAWTCYVEFSPEAPLKLNQLSNNHFITDNPRVRDRLASVRVGDQVRFTGLLVKYQEPGWGDNWRETSLSREDHGPRACETVFLESIEILQRGNAAWYFLSRVAAWFAGLIALLKFLLMSV